MKGFHGCYWRFDLSLGEGERIPIEESILQKTLGGVGLGAPLPVDLEAQRVDPEATAALVVADPERGDDSLHGRRIPAAAVSGASGGRGARGPRGRHG